MLDWTVPGIIVGSQNDDSENVCSPNLPGLLKTAKKKKCISKNILNLDGLQIHSVFMT